eukprot:TRINITY_DN12656_c0_g1_i1.p1 TRINITY_DN12656_c0_g1~~TRINITY_DN12656_c0_g1_i1.p1  ORF type:complete len:635 (-),score=93.60 TRINITY_DN12656_c0_g1_i1:216-2120(-)
MSLHMPSHGQSHGYAPRGRELFAAARPATVVHPGHVRLASPGVGQPSAGNAVTVASASNPRATADAGRPRRFTAPPPTPSPAPVASPAASKESLQVASPSATPSSAPRSSPTLSCRVTPMGPQWRHVATPGGVLLSLGSSVASEECSSSLSRRSSYASAAMNKPALAGLAAPTPAPTPARSPAASCNVASVYRFSSSASTAAPESPSSSSPSDRTQSPTCGLVSSPGSQSREQMFPRCHPEMGSQNVGLRERYVSSSSASFDNSNDPKLRSATGFTEGTDVASSQCTRANSCFSEETLATPTMRPSLAPMDAPRNLQKQGVSKRSESVPPPRSATSTRDGCARDMRERKHSREQGQDRLRSARAKGKALAQESAVLAEEKRLLNRAHEHTRKFVEKATGSQLRFVEKMEKRVAAQKAEEERAEAVLQEQRRQAEALASMKARRDMQHRLSCIDRHEEKLNERLCYLEQKIACKEEDFQTRFDHMRSEKLASIAEVAQSNSSRGKNVLETVRRREQARREAAIEHVVMNEARRAELDAQIRVIRAERSALQQRADALIGEVHREVARQASKEAWDASCIASKLEEVGTLLDNGRSSGTCDDLPDEMSEGNVCASGLRAYDRMGSAPAKLRSWSVE